MAITAIELALIKEYVKQNRYELMFNKKRDKTQDKTYQFMLEQHLTERLFVEEVISNLKSSDFRARMRDDMVAHDDGQIYVFITNRFDTTLYVKVKMLDDFSLLLVMSIHPEGMYD